MTIENNNPPKCVGFIMDGNRRFAKEAEQESFAGHLAGKDKLFEVVDWVFEKKIPHAVFYAFSTENWRRDKSEVDGLMALFSTALKLAEEKFKGKNIAVRVVGQKEDFSLAMQEEIRQLEERSFQSNPATTIWVALSYGGRTEILEAVNKAVLQGENVDEEAFSKLLWTAGMPDPDLIIRTGGEHRLSNFLPWQTVYSELFFTLVHWPAFTKDEFERILSQYANRERRVGK
jgi:undecaprenyl diphosphate synthase